MDCLWVSCQNRAMQAGHGNPGGKKSSFDRFFLVIGPPAEREREREEEETRDRERRDFKSLT